ncbi:MAG: hypothetical protein LBD58_06465 [Treponema sp.]|jgi:hypothetical protein|nr:hypothetical protein [Treponema sp.]
MNYLLFGGQSSVGKSEAIKRLEEFLKRKGIVTSEKSKPLNEEGDFYACLDGANSAGAKVRILVSSAADTPPIIRGFKRYCDSHEPYDFIISAIRDDGDPQRDNFFSTMGVTPSDYVMEIPMGRIVRINTYDKAVKWYGNAIDVLAHIIVGNAPFFI